MKRKIIFTLLIVMCGVINTLFAQEAMAKIAGYDVKKNVKCRVASTPEGSAVVFEHDVIAPRDVATGQATGKRMHKPFNIIKEYRVSAVDNSVTELKSPRDVATGQSSGKRLASSEILTDLGPDGAAATGLGVGKVSLQDFHFVINNGGNKRELPSTNGECDLPTDLPDGTYPLLVSWSWGMSQSGGSTSSGMSAGRVADKPAMVSFLLEVKDGNYMAINEKGLPGEKKPKKSTK